MNTTYAILALVLVVVAIILGFKWNINIGATCLLFAYVLGVFVMGISPRDLIAEFPVNMVFTLSAVTFFYGFAAKNGTMQWLAQSFTYASRNHPVISPFVVFVSTMLLGMISGPDAAEVFMGPILFGVAIEMGLSLQYTVLLICCSASAGGLFLYGQGGAVIHGIIEGLGVEYNTGILYSWIICGMEMLCFFIFFLIVYLVFRVYKVEKYAYEPPKPLTREQKLTLLLIGLEFLYVLLPTLLKFFINSSFLEAWNAKINIGFVCAGFATIAAILKLGDGKNVVKTFVPWSTIFMLSGVTILMAVAKEAGMVEMLAEVVMTINNKHIIFFVLGLFAAIMSSFSGATTVVCPMLFPVAMAIYEPMGMSSPAMLLADIAVCAMVTGSMSPFSTGGALALSTAGPDIQDTVFKKMVINFIIGVPAAAVMFLIISFFV